MNIRILPSAIRDLNNGFQFYENQESGAGDYFVDSISSDISSLRLYSGIHRKRGEHFRFSSKRFPYWIYYRIDGETTFVAAVLDARQRPAKIQIREWDLENCD